MAKTHRRGARHAAKIAGEEFYRTDQACLRGHHSERRTKDGRCQECWRLKTAPSQSSDKRAVYNKRWRDKHPGRENEVRIRYRYGVELSQIRPKPSHCELCWKFHKKIVLDHDHDTGKFRGWICDPCNIALGTVGDSVVVLDRMISYLKDAASQNIEVASNAVQTGTIGEPKRAPC